MGSSSKCFALLLVTIIAISSLSLVMIKSVNAKIAKPSVPEFTLKFIDTAYDSRAIELTIKNQPFVSYNDNSQIISLYYNVHFKDHYSGNWIALYYCGDPFPTPSNSDYTKLKYSLELASSSGSSYYLLVYRENTGYNDIIAEIPFDTQIDFRVQAMEGYFSPWNFMGETSSWSNTQTISISSIANSLNPTPTPAVPELSWLTILPLFVVLLIAIIMVKFKNPRCYC